MYIEYFTNSRHNIHQKRGEYFFIERSYMKKYLLNVSPIAKKILSVGLSVISVYMVYLLIAVADHLKLGCSSVAVHIYSPQLEHVIMALTILILGTFAMDITEKELDKF